MAVAPSWKEPLPVYPVGSAPRAGLHTLAPFCSGTEQSFMSSRSLALVTFTHYSRTTDTTSDTHTQTADTAQCIIYFRMCVTGNILQSYSVRPYSVNIPKLVFCTFSLFFSKCIASLNLFKSILFYFSILPSLLQLLLFCSSLHFKNPVCCMSDFFFFQTSPPPPPFPSSHLLASSPYPSSPSAWNVPHVAKPRSATPLGAGPKQGPYVCVLEVTRSKGKVLFPQPVGEPSRSVSAAEVLGARHPVFGMTCR